MIPLSKNFDLGRDRTRIKDPRDAQRQSATAEALLRRLFTDDLRRRWELQILADEVGMGKTFVSLAVAFSLLERMVTGETPEDLASCYEKVVILTPPNASLLGKWYREVSEFVTRCVDERRREDVRRWFRPVQCDRLDDFVRNLRRRGGGPRVIVAPMDVFGERKLLRYDVKRRFLLAVLFRYWGNRFQLDRRERLLRGAPAGWPTRPSDLSDLEEWERDEIPCSEDEALGAIGRLDRPEASGSPSRIETLLQECRDISEPYVRDRDALFERVAADLNWLYREMALSLLGSAVPLVIVDEAHNWKNGPSQGTNGYALFARHLASRSRRALLLTATPFQLRPAEMLELIRIGEALQPLPERSGAEDRRERFRHHREEVLKKVLDRADRSSRRFTKAWSRLSPQGAAELDAVWSSGPLALARGRIEELSARPGVVPEQELLGTVDEATAALDPGIRAFFAEALMLHAHNRDLSHELGAVVVRHRRKTEHRAFRVGSEYRDEASSAAESRPDGHVLHAAPGLEVHEEAELPHYLLMRCVSDMKRGKGRSSLGSALTGCYSTLLESSEGRRVKEWLAGNPNTARHFELLLQFVDRRADPRHPKLSAVVEEVLRAWERGEKSLVFCFRTNTAERLHDILRDRIARELRDRRRKCLGGEEGLTNLRGRLTRRDGDLIPIALDRVLWSLAASDGFGQGWPFEADALRLGDYDLPALARTCLRHGFDLEEDRVDRVFLARAVEHVIALRLGGERVGRLVANALRTMASPAWVEWPYAVGRVVDADDESGESGEDASIGMRGVQTRYPVRQEAPREESVRRLAERLSQRRARARTSGDVSVLDVDADGPSLWFGGSPAEAVSGASDLLPRLHQHLSDLTRGADGLDWNARRQVMEALRRATLRDSALVRLLPTRTERHERAWGELLVEAFWEPLAGQSESMAHRIEVFLEDLRGASGSFDDPGSARATLLDATRLRDQKFVALVKGGDQKGRERVFAGFNTPLLPEVLVCTSVGAEGIDLHRHCRHVVHYDLAWNPAVLEQRTGRIDRIGSKTFRERVLGNGASRTFLEVGVPFLAGTYDERMFEELRLRAQIFEVLTGGDVSGDNVEGVDDAASAEGKESGLRLVPLPPTMVEHLRVHLHVWETDPGRRRESGAA